MSQKRVVILAVVALLVIAAALWLSARRELPQATLTGARVLPGLAANLNEVNEIRIARGDGSATTLKRQDSGEWQVVERAWRADLGKLRRLLLDCSTLAIVEEKTHDPANYAALGVDEPVRPDARGTLLEIRSAKQTRRLVVGRASGMKSVFVRVAGEARSVLATPQIDVDVQPAGWLDRQLFDLPPERVKSVTRKPAVPPAKNTIAAPDPTFAAFTFDDLRSAAGAAPAQLTIETKDGMIVELSGLREGERAYLAVAARALEGAEPKVHREASELAARTAGRQFELPAYRFELLFPGKPATAAPGKPKAGRPVS